MTAIYRSELGRLDVERRYAETLERWPVPSEQLRVPTRFGETFIVACGREGSPPVILLQGSGANTAMWMADVRAWAGDFRVYAVDLIGEPGLSAPARPPLASDAYADWLDDVANALSIERFAIVGVSLGGWLALDYATRHPARITSVVALCPSGIGRQRRTFIWKALPLLLLGAAGRRRIMKMLMAGTNANNETRDPQFSELHATIRRNFRPRRERVPVLSDAALSRLTMPVMLIVGGRDAMLDSAESVRRLELTVPHASIRLLPEAGHILPRQTTAVLTFLQISVRGARGA